MLPIKNPGVSHHNPPLLFRHIGSMAVLSQQLSISKDLLSGLLTQLVRAFTGLPGTVRI
jgi:hypothetical protein